jgi:hypothetical protein
VPDQSGRATMGCSVSNLTEFLARCVRDGPENTAGLSDVNQVALGNSWIKWQRLTASFGFVPTAGPVGAWRASVDHNHSRSPVQRSSYRLPLIFSHPKHATSGLDLGTGTPTGDKGTGKGRVAEIDRQGIVRRFPRDGDRTGQFGHDRDQEGHGQLRPLGKPGGFAANLARDHGRVANRHRSPAIREHARRPKAATVYLRTPEVACLLGRSRRLLELHDGPLLEPGKSIAGRSIQLPRRTEDRPHPAEAKMWHAGESG